MTFSLKLAWSSRLIVRVVPFFNNLQTGKKKYTFSPYRSHSSIHYIIVVFQRFNFIETILKASLIQQQCTGCVKNNAANFQMKSFEFFFVVNLYENLHASTYDILVYIYKVKKIAAARPRPPAAAAWRRRDRHSRALV